MCCFGAIAFTHDQIAVFDLDAHSFQIEYYFPFFKKRHVKGYDLSNNRQILVEKKRDSGNYIIVLKQHDAGDIYLPSPHYTGDILMVDAAAQKIRDSLRLDICNSNPLIH